MASVIAETVITQMQLDASGYVRGANQVIAANARLQASALSLQAAMGGGVGGGGFGNNNVFNFMGGGGGGGSSGGMRMFGAFYFGLRVIREVEQALISAGRRFAEFSNDALQQYATFNTLQLSFEGIYGSAQKANQMMGYLRETAKTSAFYFNDLADASRAISVIGLDVNRFLPITQGFALAMGKQGPTGGEGLQDFIGILRRIEGGNTGVALGPRGIGRYGVSHQELEAQGAKFDAHGHFIGSTNEAFDAIEKVFTSRIKGIADKVAGGLEVTLTDVTDAVRQATVDFGDGMSGNVIQPLKDATTSLDTLRRAGVSKNLGDTLWSTIMDGVLPDGGEAKYSFSSKKEMNAYARQRFDLDSTDPNRPYVNSAGNRMLDVLIDIGADMVEMVTFTKLAALELQDVYDVLKWFNPVYLAAHLKSRDTNTLVDQAEAAGAAFKNEANAQVYVDWQRRVLHPGSNKAPGGTGIAGVDDDAEQSATGHLRAIREHTGRMARQLDLKATAFGAVGELGRNGVSLADLSNRHINASHGGDIRPMFVSFGQALQEYIDQRLSAAIAHSVRQGYVAGRG